MKKAYIMYASLIIGIIMIAVGYILLYPYTNLNEPFKFNEHKFIFLFWIGYGLMLLYHFLNLSSIYALTQRGFETLYQIIGALFMVFSIFLFVPILMLFNQFGADSPMFNLNVQWTILLVIFILQSVICLANMIILIKIGMTDLD